MRKALFISQNSIRILLGLMFIASAVMKVLSLDTFVIYVYSFKIFSFVLTEIAARLLIAFEMVLGLLLITKEKYKWTWWTATGLMAAFTLFLIYVSIFRNDENCHCFGDIIEVKPWVSIIKNVALLGVLMLVYGKCDRSLCLGWLKDEDGKERFLCGLVPDRDVFCDGNNYPQWLKIVIYSISGLAIFAATFVCFPPNAIFNKIFSRDDLVSTPTFEKAITDSLVSLHFTDIKYDAAKDTVTFRVDTNYYQEQKGTYIIAVVSSGCKYCKQSCELMHNIFERNNLPANHLQFWMWGPNYPHCARFLRITKSWAHDAYRISPALAVDMVYGSFPTFLVVKDGKIIKTLDYRGVEESKIVKYVTEQ